MRRIEKRIYLAPDLDKRLDFTIYSLSKWLEYHYKKQSTSVLYTRWESISTTISKQRLPLEALMVRRIEKRISLAQDLNAYESQKNKCRSRLLRAKRE